MDEKFSDIFDSINGLHKKYSSKEYIETIEKFNSESKDLVEILEKYRVSNKSKDNGKNIKSKKKILKKINQRKINRKNNFNEIKAV